MLLLLPLNTALLLAVDHAGLRGTPFRLAQAWKDIAALLLFVAAARAAIGRVRRGGHVAWRPADRLALIYGFLLLLLTALPYRAVPFGRRLEGARVDGFLLLFYVLGRLLPAGARLRARLLPVTLAVAGGLAAAGIIEWFASPLGVLRGLDYGGFVSRTGSGFRLAVEDLPTSYFTAFGVRRSGSLVLDPPAFAQLCVIGAGAALAVHMVRRGVSWSAVAVLVLAAGGVAAARSRTAAAALVAVAAVAGWRSVRWRWGSRSVPVLAGAAAALAVVLIVAGPHLQSLRSEPNAASPFTTAIPGSDNRTTGAHPSLQSQLDGFRLARSVLTHRPFGLGLGASGLADVRSAGPVAGQNQLFILATEGGWPLVLTMALFLIALGAGLSRRGPDHRMTSATGLVFLIAAVATGLTAQVFVNYALVAFCFLAAGAGLPPAITSPDDLVQPAVLARTAAASASS